MCICRFRNGATRSASVRADSIPVPVAASSDSAAAAAAAAAAGPAASASPTNAASTAGSGNGSESGVMAALECLTLTRADYVRVAREEAQRRLNAKLGYVCCACLQMLRMKT